ncbi:unnamed protein product [Gongylonema pulchrum]|uniref:Movement protein n=1 Tax=Gongylonema pulchrum TaxID=637853 RepID=A0A183EKL4_9BILA|nr:unnamed protein product [Gongylonema pulchrum]
MDHETELIESISAFVDNHPQYSFDAVYEYLSGMDNWREELASLGARNSPERPIQPPVGNAPGPSTGSPDARNPDPPVSAVQQRPGRRGRKRLPTNSIENVTTAVDEPDAQQQQQKTPNDV